VVEQDDKKVLLRKMMLLMEFVERMVYVNVVQRKEKMRLQQLIEHFGYDQSLKLFHH